MKKKIIALITAAMLITTLTGCTASMRREWKSIASNWTGGLNRRVTAYDYSGNVLGTWEGRFDVSERDNETYFDINGKRVIIQGAIIVNEELPSQQVSE